MANLTPQIVRIAAFAASTTLSLAMGMLVIASHTPYSASGLGLGPLRIDTTFRSGEWQMIHVLAAGCVCSRRIVEYLAARHPLSDITEQVVFVGDSQQLPQTLRQKGFRAQVMSPEHVATELGVVAAPLLIIISPAGQPKYMGGYANIWAAMRLAVLPALIIKISPFGNKLARARQSRPFLSTAAQSVVIYNDD